MYKEIKFLTQGLKCQSNFQGEKRGAQVFKSTAVRVNFLKGKFDPFTSCMKSFHAFLLPQGLSPTFLRELLDAPLWHHFDLVPALCGSAMCFYSRPLNESHFFSRVQALVCMVSSQLIPKNSLGLSLMRTVGQVKAPYLVLPNKPCSLYASCAIGAVPLGSITVPDMQRD